MKNNKYYSVVKGIDPGIYDNWEQCKFNVLHFKKAVYKSFKSLKQAKLYFKQETNQPPKLYFKTNSIIKYLIKTNKEQEKLNQTHNSQSVAEQEENTKIKQYGIEKQGDQENKNETKLNKLPVLVTKQEIESVQKENNIEKKT